MQPTMPPGTAAQRRCVLLPEEGQEQPDASLLLELLPPAANDSLEQEGQFRATLPCGAVLHWRHDAALAGRPNALAASLAQTQVCGEAVLVVQASSEADLRRRLDRLAGKHLRGRRWRLAGSWEAAGAAGSEFSVARSPQERRQHQLALQQRLLRRSVGAPASGAEQAADRAPAPRTPKGPRVASVSLLANEQQQQQQQQQQAVPRPAVLATPPLRGEAAPSQQSGAGDPRQQLLWSVAGRATSLSWKDELAAAASTAAAAAASARPPVGMQSGAAGDSAAAGVAEGGLDGGAVEHDAAGSPLPLSARHRTSLDRSPWADLQPEMLAQVLAQAGHSSSLARTMSQVCASWRQALGQERTALQQLRFNRLELLPGRSGRGGATAAGASAPSSSSNNILELPWLVQQAVKAGNVAATVAAARWLERRQLPRQGRSRGSGSTGAGPASAAVAALAGTWYNSCVAAAAAVQAASAAGAVGGRGHDEAARFWRKAAKLGHPEGQWKLGWGHYKGLMGLAADGEEALLWLGRAARQLAEVLGDSAEGGSGGNGGSHGSPGATAAAGGRPLPVLMSRGECRHILSQAAHVLGLLHLDGEGTKADLGTALKWFRLAERQGCREVSRLIGSLLNVGMYG